MDTRVRGQPPVAAVHVAVASALPTLSSGSTDRAPQAAGGTLSAPRHMESARDPWGGHGDDMSWQASGQHVSWSAGLSHAGAGAAPRSGSLGAAASASDRQGGLVETLAAHTERDLREFTGEGGTDDRFATRGRTGSSASHGFSQQQAHPDRHDRRRGRASYAAGEDMAGRGALILGQKENAPWGFFGVAPVQPLGLEPISSDKTASASRASARDEPNPHGSAPPSGDGSAAHPRGSCSFSRTSFFSVRESPCCFLSSTRASVTGSTDPFFSTPPRQPEFDSGFAELSRQADARGRGPDYLEMPSCGGSEASSCAPPRDFRHSSPVLSAARLSGAADWTADSHLARTPRRCAADELERVGTSGGGESSVSSARVFLPHRNPVGSAPGDLPVSPYAGQWSLGAHSASSAGGLSPLAGGLSCSDPPDPTEGSPSVAAALSIFPFLLPSAAALALDGRRTRRLARSGRPLGGGRPASAKSASSRYSESFPRRSSSTQSASAGLPASEAACVSVGLSVASPAVSGGSEKARTPDVAPGGPTESAWEADPLVQEALCSCLAAAAPEAEESDLRRLQQNSAELDLLLPQMPLGELCVLDTAPSANSPCAAEGSGTESAGKGHWSMRGRSDSCGQGSRTTRRMTGRRVKVCRCLRPLASSLQTRSLCDLYEEEAFFLPEQDILEVKFNWWQMLKREFRVQVQWELQRELQKQRGGELPKQSREERLLSRWSYCVSSVTALHVPKARRILQDGPLALHDGMAIDGAGGNADARDMGASCGRDGLGDLDVSALLPRACESEGEAEGFMDCSTDPQGPGGEGRKILSRQMRQRVWTWMWECSSGLGFCVPSRFLGLQLLDAYVAHELSPLDPEKEDQVSLAAVACLLIAAGLRGHWKDLQKDAYLAAIVRGLDFPYSIDEVIQTQYDILHLLPSGIMLSKTVIDYFRLYLAHLKELPNLLQHLDTGGPELPGAEAKSSSAVSSFLRQSSTSLLPDLAARCDRRLSCVSASRGSGAGPKEDSDSRGLAGEILQHTGAFFTPLLSEQSSLDTAGARAGEGHMDCLDSSRGRQDSHPVGASVGLSTGTGVCVSISSGASSRWNSPLPVAASESEEAGDATDQGLVSLFEFWKCTGLLACLEALILRSCSAIVGSAGPPLLVPPSRLVAALLLRLIEPFSMARLVEKKTERDRRTRGLPPQLAVDPDPVLGRGSIASWSRFLCTFVFRLHYDADMVFWKAVLAPVIDGVLSMEDNRCFLALWEAGSEVWANLISRSCIFEENGVPGAPAEVAGGVRDVRAPHSGERELSEGWSRVASEAAVPASHLGQHSRGETLADRAEGFASPWGAARRRRSPESGSSAAARTSFSWSASEPRRVQEMQTGAKDTHGRENVTGLTIQDPSAVHVVVPVAPAHASHYASHIRRELLAAAAARPSWSADHGEAPSARPGSTHRTPVAVYAVTALGFDASAGSAQVETGEWTKQTGYPAQDTMQWETDEGCKAWTPVGAAPGAARFAPSATDSETPRREAGRVLEESGGGGRHRGPREARSPSVSEKRRRSVRDQLAMPADHKFQKFGSDSGPPQASVARGEIMYASAKEGHPRSRDRQKSGGERHRASWSVVADTQLEAQQHNDQPPSLGATSAGPHSTARRSRLDAIPLQPRQSDTEAISALAGQRDLPRRSTAEREQDARRARHSSTPADTFISERGTRASPRSSAPSVRVQAPPRGEPPSQAFGGGDWPSAHPRGVSADGRDWEPGHWHSSAAAARDAGSCAAALPSLPPRLPRASGDARFEECIRLSVGYTVRRPSGRNETSPSVPSEPPVWSLPQQDGADAGVFFHAEGAACPSPVFFTPSPLKEPPTFGCAAKSVPDADFCLETDAWRGSRQFERAVWHTMERWDDAVSPPEEEAEQVSAGGSLAMSERIAAPGEAAWSMGMGSVRSLTTAYVCHVLPRSHEHPPTATVPGEPKRRRRHPVTPPDGKVGIPLYGPLADNARRSRGLTILPSGVALIAERLNYSHPGQDKNTSKRNPAAWL
ncbi:hypothetical protein BESB_003750 [Besnoitia besnoiti]|uniref:Uncharacterized protein n=1 Tax=Besnoitia besnoiti TaxID=94643 RepID=A0A2A9MLA8_BESBE|nr:hypothetical protein BESB_003750 [Besnoitia besnoiti]PFH38034.1 hypothetical protein BESB_003750 [Besnoitia besnoiti]